MPYFFYVIIKIIKVNIIKIHFSVAFSVFSRLFYVYFQKLHANN